MLILLTKETRQAPQTMLITHYRDYASTTNKMLTIGREGKRQEIETETQEVLSTYKKGGKGARI